MSNIILNQTWAVWQTASNLKVQPIIEGVTGSSEKIDSYCIFRRYLQYMSVPAERHGERKERALGDAESLARKHWVRNPKSVITNSLTLSFKATAGPPCVVYIPASQAVYTWSQWGPYVLFSACLFPARSYSINIICLSRYGWVAVDWVLQ